LTDNISCKIPKLKISLFYKFKLHLHNQHSHKNHGSSTNYLQQLGIDQEVQVPCAIPPITFFISSYTSALGYTITSQGSCDGTLLINH